MTASPAYAVVRVSEVAAADGGEVAPSMSDVRCCPQPLVEANKRQQHKIVVVVVAVVAGNVESDDDVLQSPALFECRWLAAAEEFPPSPPKTGRWGVSAAQSVRCQQWRRKERREEGSMVLRNHHRVVAVVVDSWKELPADPHNHHPQQH
jgi:hypothetical protein